MERRATLWIAAAIVTAWFVSSAGAQPYVEPITGFETNREGVVLPFQPASFDDLKVVMFQDPMEADVTAANIVSDANATTNGPIPSSEESFVANFTGDGFFGANGSDQSMDIRFEWANTNGDRWADIETYQSPLLGDPSLHLEGVVRLWVNFPYFTSEFPSLEYTDRIGVALLIRETGNDFPQGFRDGGDGPLEFVGVSTVGFADTANPVPVPTTYLDGPPTGTGWVQLTFDLDDLETNGEVVGWEYTGGDGILDAGTNGDGVNRGVLAGLVLTVDPSDTSSQYVEFLVDDIEFESPDVDPTYPPSIAAPVVENQTTVEVKDILSTATDVQLEIDRYEEPEDPAFVATETLNVDPAGALYHVFGVASLNVGDQIRARQTNPSGPSEYSQILTVNPAAAFSFTISLDEEGSLGTVAVFEFVGAASKVGNAPQGKPVFNQTGTWQNVEFSLVPGVEPVLDFAGGNGLLEPDGGLYNIDAIWFSIDQTSPNPGPYDVYVDHVYYVDENNNEVLISDAESTIPFGSFRGQSTSCEPGSAGCNPGSPDFDPRGISSLSSETSYDGASSNRIQWEWAEQGISPTDGGNTVAPYRPPVVFDDSAKAVGFWLLVEDVRTTGIPLPIVAGPIYGDAPGVTVDVDTSGLVKLFLNNASSVGMISTVGPASVDFDVSGESIVVGDQFTATITTAEGTSDLSRPRGVSVPPAPSIPGTLLAGQTSVDVADVVALPFNTASEVRVYRGMTLLGTAAGGSTTVTVDITPNVLAALDEITATQVVNGLESPTSGAVQVAVGALPKVVINEFVYDDGGTDDREFVELYNADTNAFNIGNWVLRASDTVAPPLDNNPDYTIPGGTILNPGDFYVVGAGTVPNVDFIAGVNDLWENANEAIQLVSSDGFVLDTVIYEANKGPVAVSPGEGGGLWGNMISEDATMASLSRFLDGRDTNVNGRDFGTRPVTPGATNSTALVAGYQGPDVDASSTGIPAPGFHGSFVNPTIVDVTTTGGGFNPNVIPASPQGGNAVVAWDPSGGGNIGGSNFTIDTNGFYDIWIYIDANTNWIEEWNIGLAGTADYWAHNLLDLGANGSSGISWLFQRDGDGAEIRLTDHGSGGPTSTWTTLGTIPLAPADTGWHRMAIYLNGSNVVGIFDDTAIAGTTEAGILGNFYIGYRESSAGTAGARPPTFDFRAASGDGDLDSDGDHDLKDFAVFQQCFGQVSPSAPCDIADMNGDDSVDIDDYTLFEAFLFGP